MPIPGDYVERVYAGVLGKLIGVYLGRPFEGWSYERITRELGEVSGYVHEQLNAPLIVTDDDISGTFTFLRALPDYHNRRDLTPAQIGQTWLNYIIEKKTILWWGGLGNSTEHTAFLRLKKGIRAPHSGSIALNGKVVAEQIGSQIFIDGWAMVAPGDPELAADLAKRASSVSHDGEAIYGAQVIAAMEAQAFIEPDIQKLIDVGVSLIPKDSVIARMIHDIREWREETPNWRTARELLARDYGYDTYGGNCHMVPNHGLIILSLLYGDDDFQKSLMIVNTSGWDTDCNSGNVGCLLGIKNGLAGIDASPYNWRGPVADRMFLPTADGGRAITDAATETIHVVNIGRALAGQPPLEPKGGARFHFDLPGSVQGFLAEGELTVAHGAGHSAQGNGSLAIRTPGGDAQGAAATATFVPPEALAMPGYTLLAAPTLYAGQTIHARIEADAANHSSATIQLFIRIYAAHDQLATIGGPSISLAAGGEHLFEWKLADTGGRPIAQVGIALQSAEAATIYLDSLSWDGEPDLLFARPAEAGEVWRRAWVEGVDSYDRWWPEAFRIIQNDGRGLLMTGTSEWRNYAVAATLTPHLCDAFGLAARVQGLKRQYALLLIRTESGLGMARIIKALDGERVLAEATFDWSFGTPYDLRLEVDGAQLRGSIQETGAGPILRLAAVDLIDPLVSGGIALVVDTGRVATEAVAVRPLGI